MNRKQPRKNCLNCGNEVPWLYGIYCKQTCQLDHQHKEWINKWLAGEIDGYRHPGTVSAHVRRFLLEECGNRCTRCGWSEINPITGKVPLTIDHINGDCKDCRRSNLVVLCPNCHSLTPTFGILNKGNGRRKLGLM
jgi:hypothetical protein